MRLNKLTNGQRLRHRLLLALMERMNGAPAPDVMRALLYRPDYFGRPYSAWLHAVMRGPSPWSVGERELIAAFTSHQNQCQFCVIGHAAAAARALGDASTVQAALEAWPQAPLDDRMKAVLGLVKKLTLTPEDVEVADIEQVRDAGVGDAAIEEALIICALFNIINRLADAFDFDTSLGEQPEMVSKSADVLLKRGYAI